MFGWGKKSIVVEAAAPVELKPAQLSVMPSAEYVEMATAAGLGTSASVIMARIVGVLSERGLYVYDLRTVEDYLDREFGGPRRHSPERGGEPKWCWIPITADDQTSGLRATHGRTWWQNGYIQESGVYGGAIPMPVVETIQALRSGVPSLKFFISGQAKARPVGDPFLAIWHESLDDVVVVERWDEPNFGR